MDFNLASAAQRQYPILAHYLGGPDVIWQIIETAAQVETTRDPATSRPRAREIAAGIIWGSYARERINLENTIGDWRSATTDEVALYDQVIMAEESQTIQAMLVELTGTRTLIRDMA